MKYLAIDVETTGLNPWKDSILGLSVSFFDNECIRSEYFPFRGEVFPYPKDLLEDSTVTKVGHNLRFDVMFLTVHGFKVSGEWEDTKLLAQMVNENRPLDLKSLSKHYFGDDAVTSDAKLNAWLKKHKLTKKNLGDPSLPSDLLRDYCNEDTRNTLQLFFHLKKHVRASAWEYYSQEMMPLEKVLMDMELRGNLIDTSKLSTAEEVLKDKIQTCESRLNALLEVEINKVREELYEKEKIKKPFKAKQGKIQVPPFNWASTQQKVGLFYKHLGLGNYCTAVTETGAPSLQKQVINKLVLPEGKLKDALMIMLEQQTYSKMQSAYVIGIKERLINGRIHGGYYQASGEDWGTQEGEGGTVTGRLSHRNPNLGNLPRRAKESSLDYDYYKGTFVKDLFIPPEGCIFGHADFSAIELRMAAHLSGDTAFIKAFNEGMDPHQITADQLGISRQQGKTVNFLLIYFGYPKRLAAQLGWDVSDVQAVKEAKRIRSGFFENHPELFDWIQEQRRNVMQSGIVKSIFGRFRRLPGVWAADKLEEEHALKQAVNFLVQSASASICKRAMLKLAAEGFIIANQVHDSIDCVFKIENAEKDLERMKHIMETTTPLSVPTPVDAKLISTFKE